MVVADKPRASDENIDVVKVVKCQKEVKILNCSDGSLSDVDQLEKCMKDLCVDQTEAVRQEFKRLEVTERKDENSDDEGVTHYGDHREEEVEFEARGPPGIPVAAPYYAAQGERSTVKDLAGDITRQTRGKRGHNEAMDPLSKGFRPNVPLVRSDFKTVLQNQLSGGSVAYSERRPGNPTVRELLAEKEKQQQQQLEMSLKTIPPPMGMNIPLDPPLHEDEQIPSFDIDEFLKTVEESEKLTDGYYDLSNVALQMPQQTAPVGPDTRVQPEGIQRLRNQPSVSDFDPKSPESGYLTSSPAPSSPPRSPSSRPSSFGEENKLTMELDEQLQIVEEFLRDKEIEEKNQQARMPLVPPTSFVVVSVPNVPSGVPTPTTQGKGQGRSSNSNKGRQALLVPNRRILPKPAPSPTIPTTVSPTQPPVQTVTRNSATQAVLPAQSFGNIQFPAQKPVLRMLAPKKEDPDVQRGDPLMKRTIPDVLVDTKMKIRAHRQIVGKPLEEILKVDADGDMLLHSYIFWVNENQHALYMINAIIQRMKREHKESNINIKQVINTQNIIHQTPVYLATVMNNLYVLDWLLKAGGDPNIMASTSTPSATVRKGPLHYAASRGDECLDVLYVLLECRETDINLKNTDGLSPLHVAVKYHGKPIPNSGQEVNGGQEVNSTRVIEALIQKGANLEEVDDKNGKTPIHNLVECQSFELISAIFNVIPEVDLKKYLRKLDFQRNTALHTAAQCAMSNKDEHKKIIQLLLAKGADPSIKNAENHTASGLVYKPHREELVPLLKASHGKNIHNIHNPMSPPQGNNPAVIKAGKKPVATTMNAQPTYIVLGTLPVATTQLVQTLGQPIQSHVPFVTLPQNAVLTTQTVNCGNRVTYTQMPQQNSYTAPINSPQMFPIGSPQMAQSPPQVQSPGMMQAHHDLPVASPHGPTSPPQPTATTFIPSQPAHNTVYHFGNTVH